MVTQNTFRQFSTEVLPGTVTEPHVMELVQTGSTKSVTSGTFDRKSQFSEKPVLRAILQTASRLGLTAPPTLGTACCLLFGWLWEDHEVDFWKVEWKSLIRSWKRRLTWKNRCRLEGSKS